MSPEQGQVVMKEMLVQHETDITTETIQENLVCTGTGYGLDRRVSIPGRGKKIFSVL
jgi:hypothetical protein